VLISTGKNGTKATNTSREKIMFNLLYRNWPKPPQMDKEAYFKFRLKLIAFELFWIFILIVAIFYWNEMNIILKGLITVLGWCFYPSMDSIEQIFVSYDRYQKEGLW
jgi:hypothetical protein